MSVVEALPEPLACKRSSQAECNEGSHTGKADYDEEARKLFRQLNLSDGTAKASVSGYHDADAVWRHPGTGATFFIGNLSLASRKHDLVARGIRNIVNCQEAGSQNFHESDPNFSYMRFPITHWMSAKGTDTPEGLYAYMKPYFDWVDAKMQKGENVMVHCLAGAHRAGTAGTAYVMHKSGLSAAEAVKAVKAQRPFVDPIYDFAQLLQLLQQAEAALAEKA